MVVSITKFRRLENEKVKWIASQRISGNLVENALCIAADKNKAFGLIYIIFLPSGDLLQS